ncbi:hypothetical protein ACEQ8H_005918 [Pleosporales sp. CAS-2024a]
MPSLVLAALFGLVAAQSNVLNATSTLSSLSHPSTTLAVSSPAQTGPKTALTVAQDGSGQYRSIAAAVIAAQSSGIPTVTILPGIYTEVVALGQPSVTIVGATATPAPDWSQNQVTIISSNSTPALSFGSSAAKGITVRNINFVNSGTSSTAQAPVLALRGSNMAFYGCSFVTQGITAVSVSTGTAFFANSYFEGSDKLFYNSLTIYIYGSIIVPTYAQATIVYNQGMYTAAGLVTANSTAVIDSCSIKQKAGVSYNGVYLAAPNNAGAVAIFRNTYMDAFIAPAGMHPYALRYQSFYGEYMSTGPGSYASNAAARAPYDVPLSNDQISQFAVDQIYGHSIYSGYSSTSLAWIDQGLVAAIQASYAPDISTISSSLSSASTSVSATSSVTSTISSPISTSASAAATCPTAPSATLAVSKTPGPCEFGTIQSAVNAIPNDAKSYTITIAAGIYVEQFSITRLGKVTLVGATNFANDYTQNQVRVQFSSGRLTSLGQNEQTPVINAKKANDNSGLAVYNIDFVNTYPQTANTAALAADFYGANIAAYGCSFIGFQDTLLANKGTQVFSNCYIEGSVDFIWGFSTAYFHQCMIVSNTPGSCVAAQSRATATTAGGYVFDSCMVTYSSTYGSSFGQSCLGRPYSSFSIAVYMNSYLDKHISPDGWQVWSTSNPQTSGVTFGEYNNVGPGSWQATTQRVSFATNLTDAQAASYTLAAWIGETSWLDMTAYNAKPSFSWTGPSATGRPPSGGNTTTPNSGTPAGSAGPITTASINAHPDNGTVAPAGAVVVALDGSHNATFTSLTAALASLPQDATNQTIFMYPGTYTEQVPSFNRRGAVRIIGYTSGNPGQSYKDNQVTVSYSRGLSFSPLPAGHSDADTAVVSTASNRISLYNINMVNTDNLDGLEPNYVTLAASIYGNDIAFYGCSFDAIDFIWGYSKAYFKGCTMGAKRPSSCVTAQNRASSTAIGGYIFDQCLFTSAPIANVDLMTNVVYLGRPYSQYALVIVKNSYLDKTIQPVGWKIWSATDPRTSGVTFAEYNNSGPSNWENNVAARQSFGYATLLTSDTYSLSSVMASTEWIDMTYWNSIVTPQPAISPITGVNHTFSTIQAALDAAPVSSKTNATIFLYPGVYNGQLIVNKSGHTIFQGYSEPTDDFSKNTMTIQFNHGIDTQGTTGSNTDGATVYATGNYLHAFNINFRNNFGTTQNMASLAFAVKSSKYAALFGCQIHSNQDSLSISGNLFTFKTYIEGNVDFIYGTGSAYFLASTISPNEDGASITASKRALNTTQAGFVLDQCWNPWSTSSPNTDGVQFGEYRNFGPGSNTCHRAPFSEQLSDAELVPYQLATFFPTTTDLIDFDHVDTRPFSVGIGSAQTCTPVASTSRALVVPSTSSKIISSTSTSSLPVVTA